MRCICSNLDAVNTILVDFRRLPWKIIINSILNGVYACFIHLFVRHKHQKRPRSYTLAARVCVKFNGNYMSKALSNFDYVLRYRNEWIFDTNFFRVFSNTSVFTNDKMMFNIIQYFPYLDQTTIIFFFFIIFRTFIIYWSHRCFVWNSM